MKYTHRHIYMYMASQARVAALIRPPPSLIITDTQRRIIDGYALCEILRRDAATPAVPIIVAPAESRLAQSQSHALSTQRSTAIFSALQFSETTAAYVFGLSVGLAMGSLPGRIMRRGLVCNDEGD